ncbi:MAG: hypothetical protein K8T89_11595 [Planctomycetes bacterium]|nr:hypothetical protein [Planctomycetota bacterium]
MRKLAILSLVFGMVSVAWAADKDDPTGTWHWEKKSDTVEALSTLKLELKDGKLTGTLSTNAKSLDEKKKIKSAAPMKIENGKFENGEVSFTTTNTVQTKSYTTKYNGKIEGDTIKGSITNFSGKKFDWEAKRVVEKKN